MTVAYPHHKEGTKEEPQNAIGRASVHFTALQSDLKTRFSGTSKTPCSMEFLAHTMLHQKVQENRHLLCPNQGRHYPLPYILGLTGKTTSIARSGLYAGAFFFARDPIRPKILGSTNAHTLAR